MASRRKPVKRSGGKVDARKLAQGTNLVKKVSKPAPQKRVAPKSGPKTFNHVLFDVKKGLKGTPVWVLDIPWEAQLLARNLGVYRHPVLKSYLFEGLTLPDQLQPYRSEDYSLERWIEDELNNTPKPIEGVTGVMKPRKHQVEAIRKIEGAAKSGWSGFVLADNVGTGKAQPLTSLVLTVDGFKMMGDIVLGDKVVNPAGGVTKVVGVHLQGSRPVYNIVFTDGSSVLADEEHIWWVKKGTKKWEGEQVTTSVLKTKCENGEVVFFDTVEPVDNLKNNNVLVGFDAYVEGVKFVKCRFDGHGNSWGVTEILGCSLRERKLFLQGMMDAKGVWDIVLQRNSFVSDVEQETIMVTSLVESLGGVYVLGTPVKLGGSKRFSVNFLVPSSVKVFRFQKKHHKLSSKFRVDHNMLTKQVESVTFIGNMLTQCISVNSANHLYVTDHFIVTHNTISSVFGAYVVAKTKNFTPKNKAKVLIVAPKSVLPHWRNTLKATGVNNMRVVVINYDQAKKLLDAPNSASAAKKVSTVNRRVAEDGKPTILWDIIIADESHKLKNLSQRTAAFTNIARYAAKPENSPFVLWCSATIGQAPLELAYLAPLVGQMGGFPTLTVDNWGDWLIANNFNVKKSKAGNFSWVQPKPESSVSERAFILKQQRKDVDRLSGLLFNDTAPTLRRNPEDISGWPSQTYSPTPISLSSEGDRMYQQLWQEFRHYIGLNPRGKNPIGGLAATLRFRQKASLLSALPTAEFVNDLLENGVQVAVSVEFLETLDVIKDFLEKKGWHCAEFSGRNVNERENERLRFQKGDAQVMLFTVQEAISLHAGEQLADGSFASKTKRALVVQDVRYSAIAMTQICGRTTRDGQLANAYLMYTENTIEPKILQVMLERMKNVRALSGDDEETQVVIQQILDGV